MMKDERIWIVRLAPLANSSASLSLYLRALPPCLHPMQRYLNALQKYNFFSELPNFMVKNLYIPKKPQMRLPKTIFERLIALL